MYWSGWIEIYMEKKIYVIRHCEAEGQPRDAALTDRGLKQAGALAEFFSNIKIDHIISSPFKRAIQSVGPISEGHQLIIEKDERLTERVLSAENLPDWPEKLKASFDDMDLVYDCGESGNDAARRASGVVADVLGSEHESTILVTHGNLMALLLKHYHGNFGFEQWKNMTNPDIYLLRFENKGVKAEHLW